MWNHPRGHVWNVFVTPRQSPDLRTTEALHPRPGWPPLERAARREKMAALTTVVVAAAATAVAGAVAGAGAAPGTGVGAAVPQQVNKWRRQRWV